MALPASFFQRSTLTVARELIGAVLVAGTGRRRVAGRIVEAEAYLGNDDPASHAAAGPTKRAAIMFGPAGMAYVYFVYGMYHCLNVVTEPEGRPGAVLLRALEPLAGQALMARRRRRGRRGRGAPLRESDLASGPGKLCQACGIDLAWNGLSFLHGGARGRYLSLEPPCGPAGRVVATTRIGVRRAASRPYRFVAAESDCLSSPVRPRR